MTQQQQTDDEGFAKLQTQTRSKYSTIDQHRDGNAHPKPRPGQGRFYNRNTETKFTPFAQAIIDAANKGKG